MWFDRSSLALASPRFASFEHSSPIPSQHPHQQSFASNGSVSLPE
jgi:hypothetical protein